MKNLIKNAWTALVGVKLVPIKEVEGLSCGEITTMLQACVRRKVENEWGDKLATSVVDLISFYFDDV